MARIKLPDYRAVSMKTLTHPANGFGPAPEPGDLAVLNEMGTGVVMSLKTSGKGWTGVYGMFVGNAHGREIVKLTP